MKKLLVISSLTLLTACGDARENGMRMADGVKENFYATKERVEEWAKPTPKKPEQPVPASYCYNSYQDILCYRQPMTGWEARLVGYQGTNASAPPPAMTQPMPMRTADNQMLPENRALTAKPLAPEVVGQRQVETAADDEVKAITIDAAHESLPDPTLAPQL